MKLEGESLDINDVLKATASNASLAPKQHTYSVNDRPLTDLGNAERLCDLYGASLRYCQVWDSWLVWDGCRWKRDQRRTVERFACRTIRSIYAEAAACGDKGKRKYLGKHAQSSENVARLRAMVELAQGLEGIPVEPCELDTDPWLFNCASGVMDLRTGVLLPHDSSRLITKFSPVKFDPKAQCPLWLNFLARIMGERGALIAYLQRLAGYALTGVIKEHILVILHGSGANGKSTLARILQHIMGEYAIQAPPELLLAKRFGSGHPCDVADLFGARFVVDSEADDGRRLDAARVKRLTGGDPIKARYIGQDYFQFPPTFKLATCVNHKPIVRGDDDAMWRRIHLVPFLVTIPDTERDLQLVDKLIVEAAGILAWAVEGCRAWQKDGLLPPPEVLHATAEYKADMDDIGQFIAERCILAPSASQTSSELYDAFKAWCEAEGRHLLSQKAFGTYLKSPARALMSGRNAVGRSTYFGIRLREVRDGPVANSFDGSSVVDFLNSECVTHEDIDTDVSVLYSEYSQYCGRRGQPFINVDAFVAEFEKQGFVHCSKFEGNDAFMRGIGLLRDYPDATLPEGSEPSNYDRGLDTTKAAKREVNPSDSSVLWTPSPQSEQDFHKLIE